MKIRFKMVFRILILLSLFIPHALSIGQSSAGSQDKGDLSVSFNGTFLNPQTPDRRRTSSSGEYSCWFRIDAVSDEMRLLSGFHLYHQNEDCFFLADVPGSDVMISNSGMTAFLNHSRHFENRITIHFFDPKGNAILTRSFKGAGLFGFSARGNQFGVGTRLSFQVFSLTDGTIHTYDKAMAFDLNERKHLAAFCIPHRIHVFHGDSLLLD